MHPNELTPERIGALDDDARAEAQRQIETLQILGSTLQVKLRDYVSQREPIERRMVEDLRQYHGRYDAETEAAMSSPRYKRSKVFANITRSKTNAAEARLADMLFPADDKNWGIEPTPVPEIADALKDQTPVQIDPTTGQPTATVADAAQAALDAAKKAAEKMGAAIEDVLIESDYVTEARRAIHQAAMLGTGVLKGPIIVNRTKKRWQALEDSATGQTVRVLQVEEDKSAAVEFVDVWNFFPDPAADSIENCDGIFERRFITKRQVRELAKRPGYFREQIKQVLREEPGTLHASSDHLQRLREISGITGVIDDSRYELWEYHGELDVDTLRAAGVEVEDDSLQDMQAVVLFIGETVIFADINPLETDEHPYSVFQWERDDAGLFGFGVPYLMRHAQRVTNAAWRMLMDNSGVAVGPQIVAKMGKVAPADGDWNLTPMKMWKATDPNLDVRDVFTTFDIASHQPELMNIIQAAEMFADKETSLPMLAQGEQGQAPDTATGMSMVMNAANTVLRRMVKAWDDLVTKPIITRLYDWHMQFSDDEEIKGDYQVEARGTTALMVKELQSQQMLQFLQFYGHPAFAPLLAPKAPAMLRKVAEVMRLNPAELIPSDDEIQQMQQAAAEAAAQQGQAQDPRIATAQMRAQADVQRAQYQAQADQVEMQVRQQMAEQDMAYNLQKLQMEREIAMLKLANERELTLEQIKAQLAQAAVKDRTAKELFAAERDLKLATGQGI